MRPSRAHDLLTTGNHPGVCRGWHEQPDRNGNYVLATEVDVALVVAHGMTRVVSTHAIEFSSRVFNKDTALPSLGSCVLVVREHYSRVKNRTMRFARVVAARKGEMS